MISNVRANSSGESTPAKCHLAKVTLTVTFAIVTTLDIYHLAVSRDVVFAIANVLDNDPVGIPCDQDIDHNLSFDPPSFHDVW